MTILLEKQTGLFVCGMEPGFDRQEAELELAFPKKLFAHTKARAFVGGEFKYEKMNFLQQIIIKKISKINTTTSDIKFDVVDFFISSMQK